MKARPLVALLTFLVLAAAPPTPGPAPRLDSWRIIGPGGGGTMLSPTISPHDPNLVVERCDMTGGYITQDGAQSWRMFALRNVIETFAFDPHNPKVIYAGNAALWRSEDTGRSWRMLFPAPARNTVEHQTGDHSNYSLSTADPAYFTGLSISAIAIGRAGSNTIYVAYAKGRTGSSGLLISKDHGANFKPEREFPSDQILLLHPTSQGLLVVGSKNVYRQTGATWQTLPASAPMAQAGLGESANQVRLYATTRQGTLAVSEDEGRSWQTRTPALGQQSGRFETIATSAKQPQTAYAGFRALKLGPRSEDLYNGIAKTTDGGRTWAFAFRESTSPAANLDPSHIESRARFANNDIWFDAPASLGVAPSNPDICYATDLFRTYRTTDGGKSWAQVNSVRVGTDRWTTRGLDVTTNYGVHFDPFDPQHILISYTDIGGFHSFDGGHSWQTATDGVPVNWRNTTYWLELDPQVKNLVWGAFSGVHDLPRPKMWSRNGTANYTGGVAISTDGGRHWTASNSGMPQTAVTHILMDPASPAGRRTLYACGFAKGVYKSTDNGKSWTLKNNGITEPNPFAWRITRANDGRLYLLLARNNNGNFGEPGGGALYVSTDGADSWRKLALPPGVNAPNGLTLDPRDNRRMYLAAWGQGRPGADTGGGVYLSTDAGSTWKPIFEEAQHVYDVTVDPRHPGTLYLCGFDSAAYRSTDAGLHWSRLRGYNFKWGHRVIPDPRDASKIYITTFGGSVWHGPAAGDPNAPEDIVSPVPIAH